jgi:5'-3' exonuclease
MTSPYEQQSWVKDIIVSIDKDFMQVPGWHYNFVKKVKKQVTPEEGLRFFYKQILMGDSADNIKGIHRVGEVTATKMLAELKTEKSYTSVVWRRWAQSVS